MVVRLMAEDDRITLIIEGLPEDEGQVRLSVFMTQLQRFSATVAKLDKEANAGKAATYFRIAALSFNSPVRVVLEPQSLERSPYMGAAILDGLERVASALEGGHDLSGLDADLLEDIRGLSGPVGKSLKSAALVFRDRRFELTSSVTKELDYALAVDEECTGSVEGALEQINVHLGANIFHIYPEVGPRKLTCRFPSKLYDDAVAAVGKRVEVFGVLHFRAGASFPHAVTVEALQPIPSDSELPDWEDLRGLARDATGDLSSEEFVRRLRDEWR
jgi:hypothetical protein